MVQDLIGYRGVYVAGWTTVTLLWSVRTACIYHSETPHPIGGWKGGKPGRKYGCRDGDKRLRGKNFCRVTILM